MNTPIIRSWYTMEDFFKGALMTGREKEAIALILLLPEASREKYRIIWKEFKALASLPPESAPSGGPLNAPPSGSDDPSFNFGLNVEE